MASGGSSTGGGPYAQEPLALFSVGHSTRSTAELVELLRGAGVWCLVDVRSGCEAAG